MKMIKRKNTSQVQSISVRLVSILIALLTGGFFISLMGHNPLQVYQSMIDGAFGSEYRILETLKIAIPIILASIGIMIAFKMKFWNIGGEGQILMGACFSTYFALNYSHLPKPALLSIMFVAGFVGGGLWALIPAVLRQKYGTNETIITLMLNYLAINFISYLQAGPWRDPDAMGFQTIPRFEESAELPEVFGLHIGWLITLVIVIIIAVLMKYSKWGYYINVIGESQDTARYSGLNINKIVIRSIIISGGICGLVGFIQAAGVEGSLTPTLSGGYGFTAIITTWLSALMPSIIIPVSFLFAVLVQGADFIQTVYGIPSAAADVLQGLILFFVIGSQFFTKYKLVFNNKGGA